MELVSVVVGLELVLAVELALVSLGLPLESLRWSVGAGEDEEDGEDEVWLELALPDPELEPVGVVLAVEPESLPLEGLLWSVGRSGSETGSVSCDWPAEPEPEPLPPDPPPDRPSAGCLR